MRQPRVWIGLLIAGVLALPALADHEQPSMERKKFDEVVYKTLRDVINRGVELYNGGDPAGCYRVFEGALRTVGPMLDHRPELQKAITTGLASAERDPIVWRRAFSLRSVLDKVRAEVNPAKGKEKLPAPKPPNGKTDKKDEATVEGKVTLDGKVVEGGTITLVAGKVEVKGTISDEGEYSIKGVKPGDYTVTVKSDGVPAKYSAAATSGLKLKVEAGSNKSDIGLKGDKPDDKKNDDEKKKEDEKKKKDDKTDDVSLPLPRAEGTDG